MVDIIWHGNTWHCERKIKKYKQIVSHTRLEKISITFCCVAFLYIVIVEIISLCNLQIIFICYTEKIKSIRIDWTDNFILQTV